MRKGFVGMGKGEGIAHHFVYAMLEKKSRGNFSKERKPQPCHSISRKAVLKGNLW